MDAPAQFFIDIESLGRMLSTVRQNVRLKNVQAPLQKYVDTTLQ
jgi:hypothetical protein